MHESKYEIKLFIMIEICCPSSIASITLKTSYCIKAIYKKKKANVSFDLFGKESNMVDHYKYLGTRLFLSWMEINVARFFTLNDKLFCIYPRMDIFRFIVYSIK